MFCKHCGTSLPDNSQFCPSCGTPTSDQAAPVPVHSAPEPVWESKSISVANGTENFEIEKYESFGWELLSSQVVKNKDSHLENRFGAIYNVTETEQFVNLVFRRNKNRKNYEKLVELEEEYDECEIDAAPPTAANYAVPRILGLFLTIGGFVMALSTLIKIPSVPIIALMLIPYLIAAIAGIFIVKKSKQAEANYYKEKEKAHDMNYRFFEARAEIMEKAKKLL